MLDEMNYAILYRGPAGIPLFGIGDESPVAYFKFLDHARIVMAECEDARLGLYDLNNKRWIELTRAI